MLVFGGSIRLFSPLLGCESAHGGAAFGSLRVSIKIFFYRADYLALSHVATAAQMSKYKFLIEAVWDNDLDALDTCHSQGVVAAPYRIVDNRYFKTGYGKVIDDRVKCGFTDPTQASCAIIAASFGNIPILEWLQAHDFPILFSRYKVSPLSIAVEYGHTETVSWLVEKGARFHACHQLIVAISKNQVETTRWILKHSRQCRSLTSTEMRDIALTGSWDAIEALPEYYTASQCPGLYQMLAYHGRLTAIGKIADLGSAAVPLLRGAIGRPVLMASACVLEFLHAELGLSSLPGGWADNIRFITHKVLQYMWEHYFPMLKQKQRNHRIEESQSLYQLTQMRTYAYLTQQDLCYLFGTVSDPGPLRLRDDKVLSHEVMRGELLDRILRPASECPVCAGQYVKG